MQYLGLLVKSERIQQEISQETLCHGICSNSYLSKIESANVIASEEIYALLFQRLNIQFYSIDEVTTIDKMIDDCFLDILFQREIDFLHFINKIQTYLYSPIHIKIILVRLHLLRYQNKPFADDLLQLEALETFFSEEEYYYYSLLKSYTIEESLEAIHLLKSLQYFKNDGLIQEVITYRYFTYGDYAQAIQYGEKAYQLFALQGNIKAMCDAAELIASSYGNLENIVLTKQWLNTLQQINTVLKDPYIDYGIAYNLGASYLSNEYYEEAKPYLEQAYQYIPERTDVPGSNAFPTYQKLILTELGLKNNEQAQIYLQEYSNTYQVPSIYQEDYALLQYKVQNPNYISHTTYLSLLEETYHASKSRKHHGNAKFYAKELVNAYQAQRKYKQAYDLAKEYAFVAPVL